MQVAFTTPVADHPFPFASPSPATMENVHVPIPRAVLSNLAQRLPNLFADIHVDDIDVQCLYNALMAAAAHAGSPPLISNTLPPVSGLTRPSSPPLSPLQFHWGRSSPTVGPPSSRPSSPSPLELNSDTEDSDNRALPIASYNSRTRKRKLSDASSLFDASFDLDRDRAGDFSARDQRAFLRDAAREADADRVAGHGASCLRGGWGPECRRAGDRMWAAHALAPINMQGGLPMVAGPDGLAPDPSLALEDGYSAGVGAQGLGEDISERAGGGEPGVAESDEDESEEESTKKGKGKKGKKTKGPWMKVVRKALLKKDASQLIASLTVISCTRPEANLFELVKRLTLSNPISTHPDPASGWVIGTSDPSATPIANLVEKIESTALDVRQVDFWRMIMMMQLALLVE